MTDEHAIGRCPPWDRMEYCTRRAWLRGVAAGAAGLALGAPRADSSAPLRFGLTPVVPDDRAGFLQAWGHWLETRLERPVVFVQRSRYREILDQLLQDRLDLAWLCGYPYVQQRARLRLVVVPRFQAQPWYRSYVIVGAESAARQLEDLAGGLFAWADPDSNSGYLYPRHRLRQRGHDPDRFFARTFFTWGHPRSIAAVADGLADGAAVDSYVWESLARRDPDRCARTRVLEQSPDFGFPPLVASPGLPDWTLGALQAVLIGQVRDAVGRALLRELDLDGFGIEPAALYDDIAAMAADLTPGPPA